MTLAQARPYMARRGRAGGRRVQSRSSSLFASQPCSNPRARPRQDPGSVDAGECEQTRREAPLGLTHCKAKFNRLHASRSCVCVVSDSHTIAGV